MEALDGNSIGGLLIDVFGADMTAAASVCGGCGARRPVAELAVYRQAPGTVVRCRSCDTVLMVFVKAHGVIGVDLTGLASLDDPDPVAILFKHQVKFNHGVRTGDFSAMLDEFADDAEMIFVGIPVGPFRGKADIAGAYTQQPPDDTLTLLRYSSDASSAHADYAWDNNPGELAGHLDLDLDGSKIRRLTITYLRPS